MRHIVRKREAERFRLPPVRVGNSKNCQHKAPRLWRGVGVRENNTILCQDESRTDRLQKESLRIDSRAKRRNHLF